MCLSSRREEDIHFLSVPSMRVWSRRLTHSYVLGIEEKNAELEEKVRSLQRELDSQTFNQFLSDTSPPPPPSNDPNSDDDLDAFTEQIAKLLVDPCGHARNPPFPPPRQILHQVPNQKGISAILLAQRTSIVSVPL